MPAYDPLSVPPGHAHQESEYFTKLFHDKAFTAVTDHSILPSAVSSLYVKTFLPLAGCDPLVGISSQSSSEFTSLGLAFQMMQGSKTPLSTRVTKFSNGSVGLSAVCGEDSSRAILTVHAKTPGFDETSSGRFTVDIPYVFSNRLTAQLDCQVGSLERAGGLNSTSATSSMSIGTRYNVSKTVALIHQVALRKLGDTSTVAPTVFSGVKFQPCSHMHAGVGLAVQPGNLKTSCLHTSMYFETHNRTSFGFIGKWPLGAAFTSGSNKIYPLSLQFGCRRTLPFRKFVILSDNSNEPVEQSAGTTKPISNVTTHAVIPPPVVGVNYDIYASSHTLSSYLEFQVSVPDQSSLTLTGRMRAMLRFGFAKSLFSGRSGIRPLVGIHIDASETVDTEEGGH